KNKDGYNGDEQETFFRRLYSHFFLPKVSQKSLS
ncbi:unnamed protein product, partial [marine sediment metagenome]